MSPAPVAVLSSKYTMQATTTPDHGQSASCHSPALCDTLIPMQRERLPYLILPSAALIAILPLLIHGCSCGHDFDFHLLSWMEAGRQFLHGNLHPHWAYTPAYNAGEPRFVFYPPLSWTLGALLGLILPWTWTPLVYTWLALTVSGLTLYRLARDFTTSTAALLAAAFYTVNPYMLFTAYERTAYAELLAAAWIPLLLHAILRKQVTIPRIAIPIALLWLTNAPAAVMSCYALALITAIRLIVSARVPGAPLPASGTGASEPRTTSRLQLALNSAAGTLLGLGLAAFYIVPAAYERHYVQIAMAILPGMRIQDNFLFHHTADIPHDQVLRTASLIALILIALTAITLTIVYVRHRAKITNGASLRLERSELESSPYFADVRHVLASIAILPIAITLLLTPITAFIWNHAPELVFLQFPWRLLAILAAILSLTAAFALSPLKLKPIPIAALVLTLAAALTCPTYVVFHQSCDEEDTVQARQTLFHSTHGTDPTDEYTPITADNDSLAHNNPAFWLSQNPDAKAPANATPGPAPTRLTITSPIPQTLILNLRDYPTWRITLNQTLIATRQQRDDGLIAIPIPAGPSTVSIAYAQAIDQTIGTILTALSLALLFLTLRRRRPL
jgi:hypothetical protein